VLREDSLFSGPLYEAVVVAEEDDSLAAVSVVLRVRVDNGLVTSVALDRIRVAVVTEATVLVQTEDALTIGSCELIVKPGELDYPFLVATPARVQSRFVNESGDQIQRLFREAARLEDQFDLSVVFFDEIDALLPARGRENQHQEDSKIVAEFLSYLERSSENNTLVIAATNRRDELDPAAIRPGRIDRKLHFGYPDRETRYSVLKQHL